MSFSQIEKPYVCVDTFAGFTDNDVTYEVLKRRKDKSRYYGFRFNRKAWFDQTMRCNNIERVRAVQTDVGGFDFATLGTVSFCLDVDLYAPTRHSLSQLYPRLTRGGVIVVDDCVSNNIFDGAHKAYSEFCASEGLTNSVVCGKLGVIERNKRSLWVT